MKNENDKPIRRLQISVDDNNGGIQFNTVGVFTAGDLKKLGAMLKLHRDEIAKTSKNAPPKPKPDEVDTTKPSL